jgi:hypothetical protein
MSDYNTNPLPCTCGNTKLSSLIDDNAYLHIECKACGRVGGPGWFWKDCGMEGLDDEALAAIAWNDGIERGTKHEPVAQGA